MPGFNGTGPAGRGPMSGQGRGYCILKVEENDPADVEGYIGIQGSRYYTEAEKSGSDFNTVSDSDAEESHVHTGGMNMPRGNGTGPAGMGPMTGRGLGFCAGYSAPGYAHAGPGRGVWGGFFGRGRGRGYRNMYWATGQPGWARYGGFPYYGGGSGVYGPAAYQEYPTADDEKAALRNQAQMMQDNLEVVKNRIEELEKTDTNEDS